MSRALAEAGVLPAPPRILRITIKSNHTGQRAWAIAKVPYGGAYALTETLTRAVMTREIAWFRLEAAPAGIISGPVRLHLTRWPEALAALSERTGVSWLV